MTETQRKLRAIWGEGPPIGFPWKPAERTVVYLGQILASHLYVDVIPNAHTDDKGNNATVGYIMHRFLNGNGHLSSAVDLGYSPFECSLIMQGVERAIAWGVWENVGISNQLKAAKQELARLDGLAHG